MAHDQQPGSREDRMVVLRRGPDGVPTVWCDPEIADLVGALNNGGVPTVASCSGHGHRPGCIALKDGRWLVVAYDDAVYRRIEALFPRDINGTEFRAVGTDLLSLAARAVPFLRDEGAKYADDGSNEPLELAREIEAALATAEQPGSAVQDDGCDCPGVGKTDPRLHAPNCPVRTTPPPAPDAEQGDALAEQFRKGWEAGRADALAQPEARGVEGMRNALEEISTVAHSDQSESDLETVLAWLASVVDPVLAAAPNPVRAEQPEGRGAFGLALRLLVAAGHVTEAKANEALCIARGFEPGPLAPAAPVGDDAMGHIAMLRSLRMMYDDGLMQADDHPGTVAALDAAIAALSGVSAPVGVETVVREAVAEWEECRSPLAAQEAMFKIANDLRANEAARALTPPAAAPRVEFLDIPPFLRRDATPEEHAAWNATHPAASEDGLPPLPQLTGGIGLHESGQVLFTGLQVQAYMRAYGEQCRRLVTLAPSQENNDA